MKVYGHNIYSLITIREYPFYVFVINNIKNKSFSVSFDIADLNGINLIDESIYECRH